MDDKKPATYDRQSDKAKKCRVLRTDGGGLVATMPDGTIIPCQTDIIIKQDVDQFRFGEATVTITFIANAE